MGISWTSTNGSSLNYSTSGSESGTTVQTSDYNSTMGVYSPSDTDTQSGTAVAVGGESVAVGEKTVATGDIDLEISDMGTTTVATGSTTFTGSAQSTGGDTAYASADTFAALSSGGTTTAWNIESSSTFQTEDLSEWSASSTTGVVTVYDGGQVVTSSGSSATTSGATADPETEDSVETVDFDLDDTQSSWDLDSGNIATLDVDAAAYGEDTFISVDASMLTVEGQISVVSAVAIGAVD